MTNEIFYILEIMLSLQNHISIYGSQFQNFQVFNSHMWLVVSYWAAQFN